MIKIKQTPKDFIFYKSGFGTHFKMICSLQSQNHNNIQPIKLIYNHNIIKGTININKGKAKIDTAPTKKSTKLLRHILHSAISLVNKTNYPQRCASNNDVFATQCCYKAYNALDCGNYATSINLANKAIATHIESCVQTGKIIKARASYLYDMQKRGSLPLDDYVKITDMYEKILKHVNTKDKYMIQYYLADLIKLAQPNTSRMLFHKALNTATKIKDKNTESKIYCSYGEMVYHRNATKRRSELARALVLFKKSEHSSANNTEAYLQEGEVRYDLFLNSATTFAHPIKYDTMLDKAFQALDQAIRLKKKDFPLPIQRKLYGKHDLRLIRYYLVKRHTKYDARKVLFKHSKKDFDIKDDSSILKIAFSAINEHHYASIFQKSMLEECLANACTDLQLHAMAIKYYQDAIDNEKSTKFCQKKLLMICETNLSNEIILFQKRTHSGMTPLVRYSGSTQEYDSMVYKTEMSIILEPLLAKPYFTLAMECYQGRSTLSAIPFLQICLKLDPNILDAYLVYAKIEASYNHTDKSIKIMRDCMKQQQIHNPDVPYDKGKKYLQSLIAQKRTNNKAMIEQTRKRLYPQKKLNHLVGLKSVKKQIQSYINRSIVNKLRTGRNDHCELHLVFMGNPGTGKTTVARILGKLLYQKGVTQNDNFVHINATQLISRWYGSDAKRVRKAVTKATGGVLFIDEAYELAHHSRNTVGQDEAMNQMIDSIEDHRHDLVVILAGYTDLMKDMLTKSNPGLQSRFPLADRTIFPNYSAKECCQIMDLYLNDNHLSVTPSAKKILQKYVKHYTDVMKTKHKRQFANARTVRNIYDVLATIFADRIMTEFPSTEQRKELKAKRSRRLNTIDKVDVLKMSQRCDDILKHLRNKHAIGF